MLIFHSAVHAVVSSSSWLRLAIVRTAASVALCLLHAAPMAVENVQGAYLLVHFTEGSADSEQIYFSVSEDGLRWNDLNGSQPVLRSDIGEKGVRDPSIIRTPDRFLIVATDLRIANRKGWKAAMHLGSTSLVIFESKDLVHWSPARLVNVAGAIPQAGCAWAPEAIYDDRSGDYLVYWATISPAQGVTKPRIYYSRTKDFISFSAPQLYIDRPGATGLIDTQIVEVRDPKSPYRYYRASGDGQITFEGSHELLGDWVHLGDLRSVGLTGKDVEGPILFRMTHSGEWGIWVDQYAPRGGYLALATRDLSKPDTFRRLAPDGVDYGSRKKRHGSILNISTDELSRLRAAWPSTSSPASVPSTDQ